jgi:indole-3-glycerol phosphate synthase
MSDILQRILTRKREEIAERAAARTLEMLRAACAQLPATRGVAQALHARADRGRPAVIAEVKKASPSQGVIRPGFDPPAIATSYQRHGAACLSVLTDADFFQGHERYLQAARAACALPVLRKDFIVAPWQVWETRALGADALLLIVAALDDAALAGLCDEAFRAGLDVLVEVHDADELARALRLPAVHGRAPLIGVNNRDLRTFRVALDTSLALKARMPADRLLVAESGIAVPADVARLQAAGIHAFLVGEACMRAADPGAALAALFSTPAAAGGPA